MTDPGIFIFPAKYAKKEYFILTFASFRRDAGAIFFFVQTKSTHGGNIWQRQRSAGKASRAILDFSANINSLGPPERLRSIICGQIDNLVHYPDPESLTLTGAIAKHFNIDPRQVICGNGSSELLYALPRVLSLKRAVLPAPCYVDYARAAQAGGLAVEYMLPENLASLKISFKRLETHLRGNEIVFLGQPNNPTGLMFANEVFISLAKKRANTFFVVDEAFADFIEGYRSVIEHKLPNVFVLRSMTKFFAVPGLRLGALLGPQKIIESVRRTLPFWSVNRLAQVAGAAFFADRDYAIRTRKFVRERRQELCRELSAVPGIFVYPGTANYLLIRMDCAKIDALALRKKLLAKNIMIRACDDFAGLDKRFFRVAVRTREENECLCAAIGEIFGRKTKPCLNPKQKPALMLQGTSSGAGKSVLTAAFCRILLQDGFGVAPFKAQNMSLNSFVTLAGGEIGRAQALQAQACRLEPDVRMNPILLKPNSNCGSQVIVLGKPVGNMDVDQYVRYKPEASRIVKQAYDQLASEYDVVVLEGAGSPAEVNLKGHDIVNMSMAKYAGAKVFIAGDIDRGGVFAAFAGTFDLLDFWERKLVAGFVVNKFRGQADLLKEALDFTERRTGRPVFGVVPYLNDLQLPEEDSVAFKSMGYEGNKHKNFEVVAGGGDPGPASARPATVITISIIDLPHIANFTDFDALRLEPDVVVRIVRRSEDLRETDVLILPGSKNVPRDLAYLRASGFDRKILEFARNNKTEIIGICAGLQMLGQRIDDPHHVEGGQDSASGLGILPLTTTLCEEKTLKRVSGVHSVSGLPLNGYEIHHGQSKAAGLAPVVRRDDGEVIGFGNRTEKVWGTYLHGIFDADEFRRWFIDRVRKRKGFAPMAQICTQYDLEPMIDRLADAVRESVRMKEIYKILKLK